MPQYCPLQGERGAAAHDHGIPSASLGLVDLFHLALGQRSLLHNLAQDLERLDYVKSFV
jgi:hypothetical protein